MNVSAIIPTRNRCEALRRTLESVAGVEGGEHDFEIIVVDNGSTDATPAVCEEIRVKHPARRWRYFYEPMPGLLSGRHRGAQEASGEICAYLDDDMRVSTGWLGAVREAFERPEVVLAGGPSSPLFEAPPPDWLEGFWIDDSHGRQCAWLSLFDGGDKLKAIDPGYVWGLNFSIRRSTLFELGGFHPDCLPAALQRFQGDGESGLAAKVQRAGLVALYHPRMAVQHEVAAARLTPRYFEERAFYFGVCDSFAQLRAPSWKDSLRRLKRFIRGRCRIGRDELSRLLRRTDRAHLAGYRFHRSAVTGDAKLREWVLRDDYLDYRLPAGWERFVGASGGGAQTR